MANPYDAVVDDYVNTNAKRNTVGTSDVTPDAAVKALQQQRQGGPPAVLGMHQGNDTDDKSGAAAVSIPSNVARFAQDPARAAAVSDDHDGLARVGTFTRAFQDFTQPAVDAWHRAQLDAQRIVNAPNLLEVLKGTRDLSISAFGAAPSAALGAVTNPVASPVAESLAKKNPDAANLLQIAPGIMDDPFSGFTKLRNLFQAIKEGKTVADVMPQSGGQEYIRGQLNAAGGLALGAAGMRAGLKGEVGPVEPAVRGKAPPKPAAPTGGDGRFGLTEEGFIADAKGNPVTFTHPRDAAQWILNKGYKTGTDQLFEVATGDKPGTWHVQERGIAETAPTPPNPGTNPVADNVYRDLAERDNAGLAAAQELVVGTKTHGRDPALLQEYLEQNTDAVVRVSPQAIVEARASGEDVLPNVDVEQALALGRDVEVPLAQYLADTAGKPYADALNDATRVRDEGVSPAEAKELPEITEGDIVYHGSPYDNIEEFKTEGLRNRTGTPGTLSFTTNKNVALGYGKNIYVAKPKGKFGDYKNKEDVEKVLQWRLNSSGSKSTEKRIRDSIADPDEAQVAVEAYHDKLRQDIADGYYSQWENKQLWKDLGWDGAWTQESGGRNLIVGSPEAVEMVGAPPKKVDTSEITKDLDFEEVEEFNEVVPVIQQAVARAAKNQYLNAVFQDAKAADMTEGQMALWSKKVKAAVDAAHEAMFRRLVRQLKKERTPEWKAEYAQRLAQVEEEVFARPDVQAWTYLKYNEAPNGAPLETPAVKINKTDAVQAYGSAFVDNLPNDIWSKPGEGEAPDELAEDLGFDSGQQMLAAVRDLETAAKAAKLAPKLYLKQMVKAQATNLTRSELGFDTTPQGIAEAAQEAMVNPKVEDLLVAELKQLAKEAGLPFDRPAVELYAQKQFAQMSVKEALNIREHERAVSKLGREAEVFALKGKFREGFGKKQQQLVNQMILREAWAFKKENAKYQRELTNWQTHKTIVGMDQQYLDRIHANMVAVSERVPRFKDELDRATRETNEEFALRKSVDGISVYTALNPNQPIPQQTVAAYRDFMSMLESLAKNGADVKKVWNGFRNEEEDAVLAEMQAKADENVSNAIVPRGVGGDVTLFEGVNLAGQRVDAALSTMHRIFGILDNGDFNGPWTRIFMGGATQAANDIFAMQKEIFEPIDKDFQKTIPLALKKSYGTIIADHPFMDPRTNYTTQLRVLRKHVPVIVANMGTASGLERLMAGYGIEDYNVLHQFVDQYLASEELQWLNRTLKRFDDELFPMEEANKRTLDGVGMHKEEALPHTFTVGEFDGGYWPVTYDPTLAWGKDTREQGYSSTDTDAIADDMFQAPYRKATTYAGYEQVRRSVGKPILLDLDGVLKGHLDEVFTRVAYGQFIRSAVRLIEKPQVQNIVRQKLGPAYLREIKDWMQYLVAEPPGSTTNAVINAALRYPRNNMVMTYITGSLSVSVKQAQGMLTVLGEYGVADTAIGFGEFWYKVLAGKAEADIFSQSKELPRRIHQLEQNIADLNNQMRSIEKHMYGVPAIKQKMAYYGNALIGYADRYLTSGVAWTTARRRYLRENLGNGKDPATVMDEANRFADQGVIRTQGSGARKDLSGLRRTNDETRRTYTFAYTNVEAMYNIYLDVAADLARGRWQSGLKRLFWFAAIMPIAIAYFNNDIPDKVKKAFARGDFKTFLEWAAWEDALALPKAIPGVRDLATYAERKHFGQYSTPGGTPVTRTAEAIQKAMRKKKSKTPVKDTVSAASLAVGIPGGGQIAKTGQYAWDWATGKHKPKTIGDAVQGLATGDDK